MSREDRKGRRTGLCLLSLLAGLLAGCSGDSRKLLNVSYDPTREVFRDLNEAFVKDYQEKSGEKWTVQMSHGGSSSQARSVIDGIPADVVTLALWPDVDAIRKKGLIKDDWEERLPHGKMPWFSTIVFVVRKGNPKAIKDWPDLVKGDVQIVTPSPKTSGNGKLSFLAAWGSVLDRGGSEAEALEFVTALYRRAPVLDAAARGATTTFSQKKIGDVHLTWENEAYLEVEESKGELEIIYPSTSIRAEPPVAVVDRNVERQGTQVVAAAYLKFLYTPEAQRVIAKHRYRPTDEKILAEYSKELPPVKLFTIAKVAKDWDEAQQKFFADKGVFDTISEKK